jgi:hypothetical protein
MKTDEISTLYDVPASGNGRRYVFAAFALACVAVIVIVAVMSRNADDAPAQLRIRQDAISVQHGSSDLTAAQEGEDLGSGDTVRSDASGQAQIEFFDSSVVRIDGDTQVTLREVADRTDARDILLQMDGGRTWNRVAEMTSSRDRYEVRLPNGTVNVRGTTFLLDCRTQDTCYAVGFDGSTELTSSAGDKQTVDDGDCVRSTSDGLSTCDEKALGLIDNWVKENLADDQQLALKRAPTTPRTPQASETPVAAVQPVPRAPVRRPAPTAAPTPSPTPKPTKKPTPEPTPAPTHTRKPKPSPTSAPASPTACPTGEDGQDC